MKKISIFLATLCLAVGVFAQLTLAQKVSNIAGAWQSNIKMPTQTVNEDWTIQQKADKLSGTVKSDHGDLTFTGSVDDSGFVRADVKDGDKIYKVRASLNPDRNSMDGSITIGNKEYLWAAKKAH